jgi:hypothetical protein
MTTSAPEKPRLSPEEAGIFLALAFLFIARALTSAAKKLGGSRVEAQIEQRAGGHEYAYYSAASLEESLHRFEDHFKLATPEFTKLYGQDQVPPTIPRHAANVWAGLADEFARLHEQAQDPDEIFTAAIAS